MAKLNNSIKIRYDDVVYVQFLENSIYIWWEEFSGIEYWNLRASIHSLYWKSFFFTLYILCYRKLKSGMITTCLPLFKLPSTGNSITRIPHKSGHSWSGELKTESLSSNPISIFALNFVSITCFNQMKFHFNSVPENLINVFTFQHENRQCIHRRTISLARLLNNSCHWCSMFWQTIIHIIWVLCSKCRPFTVPLLDKTNGQWTHMQIEMVQMKAHSIRFEANKLKQEWFRKHKLFEIVRRCHIIIITYWVMGYQRPFFRRFKRRPDICTNINFEKYHIMILIDDGWFKWIDLNAGSRANE